MENVLPTASVSVIQHGSEMDVSTIAALKTVAIQMVPVDQKVVHASIAMVSHAVVYSNRPSFKDFYISNI